MSLRPVQKPSAGPLMSGPDTGAVELVEPLPLLLQPPPPQAVNETTSALIKVFAIDTERLQLGENIGATYMAFVFIII